MRFNTLMWLGGEMMVSGSYQVWLCALLLSVFFSRVFRLLLITHLQKKKKRVHHPHLTHSISIHHVNTDTLLFTNRFIASLHTAVCINIKWKIQPCDVWTIWKEENSLYVPTWEMGSYVRLASWTSLTGSSARCCRSSSSDSTSSDSSSSDAFSTFSPFTFAASLVWETGED